MEILKQPFTEELKHKVGLGLKEHAIEVMGQDGIGEPVAFVAIENNEYIGAVVAQPFWGAWHIKYVWVNKTHRRRQIGTRLLEKSCEYGKNLNYLFAFVETMSFQALEFYQKMGFTLEFSRGGYTNGVFFHYLRKDFFINKSN